MAWFEGRDKKRQRRRDRMIRHDPNARAAAERAGELGEAAQRGRAQVDAERAAAADGGGGAGEPGVPGESEEQIIARLAREADERDRAAEQSGYAEGEEFLNRDVKGMSDQERARIESNSRMRLNKSLQGPQRDVLASQGKSGVRGGAAYAQQRDIQNLAREAEREFYRDMEEEDMNRKLRNQGFIYASGKGRAATSGLNRSQAAQELQMREERKKNRGHVDYAQNAFGRI